MREVFIVSAQRTPIGSFGGVFSNVAAPQLGAAAIKGALEKAGVSPEAVEEVYFGNVCSANLGQAPAKQAALGGGIPNSVPCTTVNKVCSSGIKATMFGALHIMAGQGDLILTGGMENMSQIPFYLDKARFSGYGYGHGTFIDGLQRDGLSDAYDGMAMGCSADDTATKHEITREEQDAFAIQSYKRSAESTEKGYFKNEITTVSVPQRKKDPIIVSEDEEFKRVKFEKISGLRPVFSKEGTVTAANASTINDGAAAIVLASEAKVKELNLTPIGRIVSFADAAQEPHWFTTAPTLAAPKALKIAGLKMEDMDFFEVNEAFAVVSMAFAKVLGVPNEKMNVFGGSVSLGHPLGCSGARILTTLMNVLGQHKSKYGMAAICNGGGGASAMVVERFN